MWDWECLWILVLYVMLISRCKSIRGLHCWRITVIVTINIHLLDNFVFEFVLWHFFIVMLVTSVYLHIIVSYHCIPVGTGLYHDIILICDCIISNGSDFQSFILCKYELIIFHICIDSFCMSIFIKVTFLGFRYVLVRIFWLKFYFTLVTYLP